MTVMNPQKKNSTVTAAKGPAVPPRESRSLVSGLFGPCGPEAGALPAMVFSLVSDYPRVPPIAGKVPPCGTIRDEVGMYEGGDHLGPPMQGAFDARSS